MPNSQGVVLTNRGNQVEGKHIHNYSSFNDGQLSYRLYNTLRFGDYTPSFVMDGVERDEISVNTKDIIDSLSLNAPFKGSVRKIKESFMVPLMSILPMNWDRIYVQPSNGDDVPADANCVLVDFPKRMSDLLKNIFNILQNNVPSTTNYSEDIYKGFVTAMMRMLVTGECIYSYGSLLNVVGYKISDSFSLTCDKYGRLDYDAFFERCLRDTFFNVKLFRVGWKEGANTRYMDYCGLAADAPISNNKYGSFRAFVEAFRENPLMYVSSVTFGADSAYSAGDWQTPCADLGYMLVGNSNDGVLSGVLYFNLPTATPDSISDTNQCNLNLSRVFAYQIVCAHFYSNSSIDVIYTAELYRQYMRSLFKSVNQTSGTLNFSQNGLYVDYDFLSGRYINSLLYRNLNDTAGFNFSYADFSLIDPSAANYYILNRLVGFAAIFGFRKSLRYGDYFVGARPRPLAPINTDVSVNSNLVSVVDITQKIQVQRFANSVMRSRQKIEEYVKSLFGSAPAPDYHNPFFLTREEEIVYGDEVQNTASGQLSNPNSRTANLASSAGQFTFTFHNDDMHPCVYLQIISFDIRRAYTRSCERQFFIKDRFDMFNPDFQYIGDQAVYGMELGWPLQSGSIPAVFGYQTRDEEWKQRFDQASGGFVKNLPGWILTDRKIFNANQFNVQISPDFIRSQNFEFDQFFLSLTGYSLGNYFHFICVTQNNVSAKRAMAVDPQILQ